MNECMTPLKDKEWSFFRCPGDLAQDLGDGRESVGEFMNGESPCFLTASQHPSLLGDEAGPVTHVSWSLALEDHPE